MPGGGGALRADAGRIAREDALALLAKAEVSRSVRAMRQALRISNEESDEMARPYSALSRF